MKNKVPDKKSDYELYTLVDKKISDHSYIFLNHAKERVKERNISYLEVLNILELRDTRKTQRNKFKDTYVPGYSDWNYCIEGLDTDGERVRIIISFDLKMLLIITVIRIEDYYE